MQQIYKYRYIILAFMYVSMLCIFWPGYIQADSKVQYAQAVLGIYSDHHPPMMSFLWHYLDLIIKGEGLMYGLQISFLYAAIVYLLRTIDKLWVGKVPNIAVLPLLILPIYPQILLYAVNIVKDVHFAFSFLLVTSMLAYYTAAKQRPNGFACTSLFLIMTYGASVKYQGQFCVVVPAIWLAFVIFVYCKFWQKLLFGLLIYGCIFATITCINLMLVEQHGKNYAWQYVKLYDLAAISRDLNLDLIPEYNKLPSYTFAKLKERFQYPSVDPYIFSQDNILSITTNKQQMSALYQHWLQQVIKHPLSYFQHRVFNMCYALLSRPGYDLALQVFGHGNFIIDTIFYVFMSHLFIVILGCIYMILGIRAWSYTDAAKILVGISATALLMVSILFFMSMAGVPRYTYISIVLIHAAHIFAYISFMVIKKFRPQVAPTAIPLVQ